MKVIAYLGFTLLSILIQFCVMDLTQKKNNLEAADKHIAVSNINITSNKEKFQDLLKTFTQKPHALYYRTQANNKITEFKESPINSSRYMSALAIELSTTISSTIVDELYDENASTTEDTFTTESLFTSTEVDNVTEISFFEKKNLSTIKPEIPKMTDNKGCDCNFLYKVCDINCCCDSDCSEIERKLFDDCKILTKKEPRPNSCYPYQYLSFEEHDNIINNLFCIVKTNLPEKRMMNTKKYDVTTIGHSYKWHKSSQPIQLEFKRKPYVYGDPVWVLKEGVIWYIDTPFPTVNNYCSGRKPILFLNNMNVKCIVSMKDLEMLQIFKTSREAPCISVTEKSLNTTALNCSTLHCTNWTTIVCDAIGCVNYNDTMHEPSCTEDYCKNIALKLEYIFYYYDSKIMNSTIKLYTQTVATHVPFMNQEISVRFVLTNQSLDKITEVSGNPGYIHGRPVILSLAENNRSLNFFNTTTKTKKYLPVPSNKNGICAFYTNEPEFVLFGLNKRTKCRFVYNKSVNKENGTHVCNEIEKNIQEIFGIVKTVHISPYGNPSAAKDSMWIPMQLNLYEKEKEIAYGQFLATKTKLRCYNIITRISYIFTFADVSEVTSKRENKIVSAEMSVATQNITFNSEDVSAILTIDINFIDGTKPRIYEYAAGPFISVRLPEDFFFPFRSNESHKNRCECVNLILILCYVMYQQIK